MSPLDDLPHTDTVSRREFTAAVAMLATAPLLPAAQPQPKPPAELVEQADALLAVVKARYGKHLSEEQLKEVGTSILRGLVSARRMRQVELTNADEPAIVFSPDLP